MSTTVNALDLRRAFGRKGWLPPEPFGPDGWRMIARDRSASVIVTTAPMDGLWTHASIARESMPTYDDLRMLHHAVWGEHGYAYQVFAPTTQHVNIHAHALHLWGRADGSAVLPEFGTRGSI